ncbi:MAG: ATP-binding cassette domain-containing protein, partial [Verrucomicrobiae bacterium]|nr:ATP-binding cassette domain-containing protein [Verrucomicrobiae bacterium]
MTDQLTVSGLTKDFAGLRAVDDVSFTLERGDILGLIGPNGSGKTTTINLVTGLLKPTAGRVEVGGHDVTGAPAHKIAARGLARTFQAIKLFPELTVAENVEVAAVGTGMNRRDARTVAHTMLDELEVGHLAGLYANELAYGSERRVEIARAL